MNAPLDFRQMTADTVGRDLLQALLMELRLLPEPWPKLSKARQDDVIDRLRARVETSIKMAVHLLASEGRTVVAGGLDQITIKDGVKAVVKFSPNAENLHELYDVAGKSVLVVVADAGNHTGGMDEVAGEPDQRVMDLGHEYHDNDGGGMDGPAASSNVIDAEPATGQMPPALPAPDEVTITDLERDQAWENGWRAAEAGEPESACPVQAGELCIQWVKGWKAWHEQQEEERAGREAATARRESTIRFRHPQNQDMTWSGRGRKPAWVQEWLDEGGSLADLDVSNDDQQAA
ncbi:putative DNA segregation ATPase FtsK/SpoIIIE-like protein [Laribacter hongkongensis HLHK9]|uniref:Putative DNA segregation ATPase FtsK/SpoIIIE-like protein n=1 Tax=Laribacter hongkongensis (strain HLHK9) TaxID=557598 RepID=C1D8I9_LARHH|nr:H-NS histone family protein [Laribacter hongkongensis]ACO74779.1 putative DNA segregation ATPase FtsK/SpoIIIE-like protein [Laribacter hongkongensis HLHK9]